MWKAKKNFQPIGRLLALSEDARRFVTKMESFSTRRDQHEIAVIYTHKRRNAPRKLTRHN